MSMTPSQKKQWKQELMRDYANIEPFFLDLVLDLYEKNPDYVKKLHKKKFKPVTNEVPKEIVGGITVVDGTDEAFIKKYFKEPEYIPPTDDDEKVET
jgi:hypothetical protein